MVSRDNEEKFYSALENIFTGAKIEGQGGFVNLLKIKSAYFNKILVRLKGEITEDPFISGNFKEEFYALLYSFFEKYFSEAGCVYFVKTANWQQVYEKIYSTNKDVMLFWKTHMLYYVKSDTLYNEMIVSPENGGGVKFFLM
jgi:adenine-specific DNA-methyltransferase